MSGEDELCAFVHVFGRNFWFIRGGLFLFELSDGQVNWLWFDVLFMTEFERAAFQNRW